jgi:glycosyltransferase involved in cell wall biosynthesis
MSFTLVVVSHVVHYSHGGCLYAYGPYAREIDIWADLFPRVVITAPLRCQMPPGDCVPFDRTNISVLPQTETGGDTLREKAAQLVFLPVHLWRIAAAMWRADAIHVRCPGNLGLIGAFLAPLCGRRYVAKYAGDWSGGEFVNPSFRLQRWLLSSRWWRKGIVTVYGQWPDQPPQIVPFFTSMMTAQQVRDAAKSAEHKTLAAPMEVLYSGRLVRGKGIDVVLRAMRLAKDQGVLARLTIAGDGPEAPSLKQQSSQLGIGEQVRFVGALPFDSVMDAYARAHVLVLASNSEGWPKVIPEAMCHGVVCVGTNQGLMPWMLENRGYTVPVGDAAALADVLAQLAKDPSAYQLLSRNSAEWARQYSLEGLREALRGLLSRSWNLELPAGEDELRRDASYLTLAREEKRPC